MELERIIVDISEELKNSLRSLAEAKSVEEKVAYSEVIRNMSESLGVFFGLASEMMSMDLELEDEEDTPH